MTFAELRLAMAIKMYHDNGGDLRERANHREQIEHVLQVQAIYAKWFETTIFEWEYHEVSKQIWNYRKMGADNRLKVDVAIVHGAQCFWTGRGKGPCNVNAECGHLVANAHGGNLTIANCVIECQAHNNQRKTMTIEQYLQSDKVTP